VAYGRYVFYLLVAVYRTIACVPDTGRTPRRVITGVCSHVFPGESPDAPILVASLDHQRERIRAALKMPKDFVIHSLRHTMLTRLGEAGADAFTIMKIAGHSSVVISQRYVHPSEESTGRAFERLDAVLDMPAVIGRKS
jgi:integrase